MIITENELKAVKEKAMQILGKPDSPRVDHVVRCVKGEESHCLMTLLVGLGKGKTYTVKKYPGVKVAACGNIVFIDRTHVPQMDKKGEMQFMSDCLKVTGYSSVAYDVSKEIQELLKIYCHKKAPFHQVLNELRMLEWSSTDDRVSTEVLKPSKKYIIDGRMVTIKGWVDNGCGTRHCITDDWEYITWTYDESKQWKGA